MHLNGWAEIEVGCRFHSWQPTDAALFKYLVEQLPTTTVKLHKTTNVKTDYVIKTNLLKILTKIYAEFAPLH
jgi:hypothetical protein